MVRFITEMFFIGSGILPGILYSTYAKSNTAVQQQNLVFKGKLFH